MFIEWSGRRLGAWLLAWVVAAAAAPAWAGAAQGAAMERPDDAHVDAVLHAMGEASTVGHPDLAGLFAGMRAFDRGDYALAMREFRRGAWYGGKLAQLSIGLMYLNGQGVAPDPVSACAWLALAAERKYPRYEATRRGVCGRLDEAGRAQARVVLAGLMPEYADAATKPRMKVALARGMRESITGSFLGSQQKVVSVFPARVAGRCSGRELLIGGLSVPQRGCDTYDAKQWRADEYFAARAPLPSGEVTVGDLSQLPAPADDKAEKGD